MGRGRDERPDVPARGGIERAASFVGAAQRATEADEIGRKAEQRAHMPFAERSGKTDDQAMALRGCYKAGKSVEAHMIDERAPVLAGGIEHDARGPNARSGVDCIEMGQPIGEQHDDEPRGKCRRP
jgi:hypothetical protein